MIPLNARQIAEFVRMVGQTREQEMVCDQCLRHLSEFAETRLTGKTPDEALSAVAQHLSVCPECAEEFDALQKILRDTR